MIKKKVLELFQNKFVRVSGTNGVITLLKTGVSLFSNKIIALVIGAAGIGIVGQLQNVMTIIMLISSGGFNQGLTKYISQEKEDEESLNKFIGTAFFATLFLSVVTGIVTAILSTYISTTIFGDRKYFSVIVVFALTLFFYNLNNLLIAIINGFQFYKRFFKINITTTIVSMVMSVGLVLLFNVYGALLAIVLSQSVVCLITYWMVKNDKWIAAFSYKYFSKDNLKLLLKFTSITIFSSILWPIVGIVIRTYVIKYISVQEAGFWEATTKLNVYIVNLAVGSFAVYLLPRLAEIKDPGILKREVKDVFKIIIPVTLLGFGTLYLFRDLVIRLLYTAEFLKVGDYLGLQMVGSFFWMCKMVPMNLLLAKGKTNLYLTFEIVFCLVYVLLAIIFIPMYGVQGIQLSFAVYNFLYFIVNLIAMNRYLKTDGQQ